MIEIISVFAALTSVGLLVYFRITDAKNVTIQSLKDFLKQSEKHIEAMLHKKERDFSDRMIESEIVIERLHRMTSTLQEKLDRFDGDIVKGQEIFDELKNEVNVVQDELFEYRQIRSEFRDIEDRIEAILDLKKHAEDGTVELRHLRDKIAQFSYEYDQSTQDIKSSSRQELDLFFQAMQQDLSDYLTRSRQQLSEKDETMAQQIQELSIASGSMIEQIKNFKDYAERSIEQLRQDCENDIQVAKAVSDANATDIYDIWDKLKEQTQQDTNDILNSFNMHKEFFETAEFNLRTDINDFNTNVSSLTDKLQTNLELYLQERIHEFENKITEMHSDIERKGMNVQEQISSALSEQASMVRDELDRLHSAFVDQEQGIEDRIRVLSSRVSEGLSFAESSFQSSLDELQQSVDKAKSYADDVLQEAQHQISHKIAGIEQEFKEKASENMIVLEESFKESNHERVAQSISDITQSLEKEFKQRYHESLAQVTHKAEELEENVKSRLSSIVELDRKLEEINHIFNDEKEKIILMCSELENDRQQNVDVMFQQVQEYVFELREELILTVQEFINQGTQSLTNDQESWKERYEEVIKEGRDENSKIKQDIDKIHRFITDIEASTLGNIKRAVDRLTHDTEYKIDDFRKQMGDFFRNSKEEFHNQTTEAQEAVKSLRQELWTQENEVRQLVDKDIDRLGAKAKDIERQFQVFMKKSDKLDRVEDLMRKITQQQEEFNSLQRDFEQMNDQLKHSYSDGQHTVQQIQELQNQMIKKTEELNVASAEADRTQETLVMTIKEAHQLSHVFEALEQEKEKAQHVEELLQKNLAIFNDLQESLDGLEHNRAVIEHMQHALENSENNLSLLNSSSEEIGDRVHGMGNFAHEIHEQLQHLQQEMQHLAGDHTKVRSAVSKITDLEHVVTHIDEEMKRLDKMREWIAKSMNNIERMGSKLGASSYSITDDNNDDANTRSILRLYEKDWSIDDIAKNLKLTPAYVELIVERYRS